MKIIAGLLSAMIKVMCSSGMQNITEKNKNVVST